MGLFSKIGSKVKRGFQRIGSKKTGKSLSRIGSKVSNTYKGARGIAQAIDKVARPLAAVTPYGVHYETARKALSKGDRGQRIAGRVGKSVGKGVKALKRRDYKGAVAAGARASRQGRQLQSLAREG